MVESRLEGQTLGQCRVPGRQFLDAIKGEKNLNLKRLLAPKSPVDVETCNALWQRRELGASCFATRETKSKIADFAAPSFQEGSGWGSTIQKNRSVGVRGARNGSECSIMLTGPPRLCEARMREHLEGHLRDWVPGWVWRWRLSKGRSPNKTR